MNVIVIQAIQFVATILLGSEIFERILGAVQRWAEKELSGKEKRDGVLDELEVIGIQIAESSARFGVELAVQYLKRVKA